LKNSSFIGGHADLALGFGGGRGRFLEIGLVGLGRDAKGLGGEIHAKLQLATSDAVRLFSQANVIGKEPGGVLRGDFHEYAVKHHGVKNALQFLLGTLRSDPVAGYFPQIQELGDGLALGSLVEVDQVPEGHPQFSLRGDVCVETNGVRGDVGPIQHAWGSGGAAVVAGFLAFAGVEFLPEEFQLEGSTAGGSQLPGFYE